MKKVYNSLEEFSEAVGCFMQPEKVKPTTQWLLYKIIEPNHTQYIGEFKDDDRWDIFEQIESCGSNVVAVNIGEHEIKTLEDEIKMEQYIREYKHLLGCEFSGSPKGEFISAVDSCFVEIWNNPIVVDNRGYVLPLSNIKFYTEDYQLLTYKEYMQMYYPEYKHVWSEQL